MAAFGPTLVGMAEERTNWAGDERDNRPCTTWMTQVMRSLVHLGPGYLDIEWPLLVAENGTAVALGSPENDAALPHVLHEHMTDMDDVMLIGIGDVLQNTGVTRDCIGIFHYGRGEGLVEAWAISLDVMEKPCPDCKGHLVQHVETKICPLQTTEPRFDRIAELAFL